MFIFVFSTLHKCRNVKIDESVDGVLGTQTQDGRLDSADESTELWRHRKTKVKNNNKMSNFFRFPEQNTFCRSTLKTSTAGYIRGNPTLTAGPKRGPRFETFSRPFVSIVTTTTTSLRFNFLQQMSFARILKKFLQTDKADKILE